jgi:hypothetical protein
MSTAMKLSFHEGKFSVPCSISIDRRLLWEDDDMIATEGEREGRGEREEVLRKVSERERERQRRQQRQRELQSCRAADCKSVERRRLCVWEVRLTTGEDTRATWCR